MDASTLEALPVGRHKVEEGLYLRVSPSGTRSWLARVDKAGVDTMRSVGKFPAVSLTAAIRHAKALRADAQRGLIVPMPAKPESSKVRYTPTPAVVTLDAVWTEYARVALASGKWTQRHHDKTDERLRAHMGGLLPKEVASITRASFVSACVAVESTETGQRLYRWLRGAFEHAGRYYATCPTRSRPIAPAARCAGCSGRAACAMSATRGFANAQLACGLQEQWLAIAPRRSARRW